MQDEGTIREVIGVLRGEVSGLSEQIASMEIRNTREHEAVKEAVGGFGERVDKLESWRDRGGFLAGVLSAFSAAVGVLVSKAIGGGG